MAGTMVLYLQFRHLACLAGQILVYACFPSRWGTVFIQNLNYVLQFDDGRNVGLFYKIKGEFCCFNRRQLVLVIAMGYLSNLQISVDLSTPYKSLDPSHRVLSFTQLYEAKVDFISQNFPIASFRAHNNKSCSLFLLFCQVYDFSYDFAEQIISSCKRVVYYRQLLLSQQRYIVMQQQQPVLPVEVVEPPPAELTSAQILQLIKKKPYSQSINGVEFTFSILKKKQKSFVGTNDRFLVLKGIESLAYARVFPENTELPVKDAAALPPLKATYLLGEIESYKQDQEKLLIQFAGKDKVKWEFVCPSKVCALEWKKKIESAVNTLADFKSSKFEKFEDYLVFKQNQSYQEQANKQHEVDMLLGSNGNFQPNGQINTQQGQGNNSFGQSGSNDLGHQSVFLGRGQSKEPTSQISIDTGLNSPSKLQTQINITNNMTTSQYVPATNPQTNPNSNGFSQNGQPFTQNIQGSQQGNMQINTTGQPNQPQTVQGQQNIGLSVQGQTNQPQVNVQLQQPNVSSNIQGNANVNMSQNPTISVQSNINPNVNIGNVNQGVPNPQVNVNAQNSGKSQPQGNVQLGNQPSAQLNVNTNQPQLNVNANQPQINVNANQPQFNVNANLQGQSNLPNANISQPQFNSNIQGSNVNVNVPNQPQPNNNRPTAVLFNGSEAARVENLLMDSNYHPSQSLTLGKSMSSISLSGKDQIKFEISKLRRNWIEELLGGEEQGELVIEFRNYTEKLVEVVVNELYVPQQAKIFPAHEHAKEYASYLIDDVYIELYFFSEEHLEEKHNRYRNAALEFKNMDYLLNSTKNEGPLRVPFMMMFEYKGFLGMSRTKLPESGKFKNREFFETFDQRDFEENSKISSEVLLNEGKCKIISYDKQTSLSKIPSLSPKVYFVERLTEFLPVQNGQLANSSHNILRAELVQDEELEDVVFRDRKKQIKAENVLKLIEQKVTTLITSIENEEIYFTSSKELSELIHFHGLNIRHLGLIFRHVKQPWLKKIIQAEIASRCLKNFFRYDIQNCVTNQTDRITKKERQEEKEKRRVISFLNVLFGNTEATFRMWRSINSYSKKYFNTIVWDNDFSDLNIGYFLQALQNNLNIVLNDHIHQRRVFQSMNSFDDSDFERFSFNARMYNLSFANTFELIEEYIEEQTFDSFHSLCEILTKETSTKVPYLELLKKHPIHYKINEFLLNFTSPDESVQLYNKIENSYLPSKFLYESKLAQIKWYLKANKQESINKPATFILEHAKRWLGDVHPLFVHLNRILAEYFSEHQFFYTKALKYANSSLSMQQAIFGTDNNENLWRDYFLIGKIHYVNSKPEEALNYLVKAKELVKVDKLHDFEVYGELCLMLAKGYLGTKYYKESYVTVKELYQIIKEERDERSLVFIVEAVAMIKQLLEINQEHESYYRFVESDFSNIVHAFADYPNLLTASIKMITIPYLKNVILQKSKNKIRLLNIIEEISKINQLPNSSLSYIKAKITEGTFPKGYLHYLKEIDSVIDEIVANQMMQRWKSFNKMANQSLLDKIGNSQINRGFEFLANMTALFNLLGHQVLDELFIMEK